MFRCLVESLAYPGVVWLSAILGGFLPGALLIRQSSKGAGAQGDLSILWVSPCPQPRATMSFGHQFHVSGVYLRNLIHAIRFHVDKLDSV